MATLRAIALAVLERFEGVQPGCNGPRKVPDFPARNTAHWLNAFAWGYTQTQTPTFLEQVAQFAEYLISPTVRPHGYSFLNIPDERIAGNGLIGQAWVMEGLITATRILKDPRYAQVAAEVFEQHAFEESLGLWRILHPSGAIQQVHATVNQQIWLAAMGAQLTEYSAPSARQRIERFLDCLEQHIRTLRGGVLEMQIRQLYPLSLRQRLHLGKHLLRARLLRHPAPFFTYLETSIGYHAFTMYGLALLKPYFPDHPFWRSPKFQKALQWTYSESHRRALRRNPFAMGYNPSGFEVPYVLSVFRPAPEEEFLAQSQWWLSEQIRRHYDPNTGKFSRNTPDAPTLTARIYEATRLPDALLDIPLSLN